MIEDLILVELHRVREEIAERHNYDVNAIFEYFRAKEALEERPVVSFSPKRMEPDDEDLLPEKQAA